VPLLSHQISCTPIKCNLYLANFLSTVISNPDLYRLITIHMSNMFLSHCLVCTRGSVLSPCGMFYNMVIFYDGELLASLPTPRLEDHPLLAVWRPYLHPQPEDTPCWVYRNPLTMLLFTIIILYYVFLYSEVSWGFHYIFPCWGLYVQLQQGST
jgi:hypothetical protein